MPKDYYRSKPAPPSPPSTPPIRRRPSCSCIGWMIGGLALGVVGSRALAPTHEAPEDGDSRAPSVQPIPQPTFTYERILKDTEVDISQGPPLPPPAPRRPLPVAGTGGPSGLPPEEPAPPPESGEPGRGTFMVQVASFSRLAEAERLRARLAQLGIMTSIQTATLQNGKTTYRVRTGGYASRAEAEEIQMQLKRQGHDSLMIPIR